MRIVRWAPSERVDIPDITAMSFLVLGEFRRTLRTLFTSEENFIVRGFRVEPETPASARVVVQLAPPGNPRSVALGAERTTAGTDYGQLIGDRDSSFLNEGAAQQILDFAGQPNDTYTVELRFTYTDGVSDNRAFWNAGTNSEFVAITNTRHVSGWQIRYVTGGPSGGEWIPLADVVWDGATIDTADITDRRVLLFEGAAPFQAPTQDGVGGVEDFARDADRYTANPPVATVRDAIRALMRQVQDLKGANDSGTWDWFSRIYKPFDPTGALGVRTKNLRSIDTVTYTVGDGTAFVGDFNGVNGLDDALLHLASIPDAQRPERVEIVIYGGNYNINGSRVVLPRSGRGLTLILRGGPKYLLASSTTFQRPTITIDGDSLLAGESGILAANGSHLECYNLNFQWTGSVTNRNMLAASGYVRVEDCDVSQSFFAGGPATDAGWTIFSSLARRSRIRNCRIRGRINLYDTDLTSVPEDETGVIEHCNITAANIVLYDTTAPPDRNHVNRFCIRDCNIEGRGATGADPNIYSGAVATIDARSAWKLIIERCTIAHNVKENGIDGREHSSTRPFGWRITDCSIFSVEFGAHLFGTGTGGADGTGWSVNIQGSVDPNQVSDLQIRGCRFTGTSIDAGGVRIHNGRGIHISGCEWSFNSHQGGVSDRYTALQLNACNEVTISGNMIHRWSGSGVRTAGIRLNGGSSITITGNTLDGAKSDGTDITGRAVEANAIDIETAISETTIVGNVFTRWNPGTVTAADSSCIRSRSGGSGASVRMVISNNVFRDNGGFCCYFAPGGTIDDFVMNGNTVYVGTASGGAGFSLTNHGTITGNYFQFQNSTSAITVPAGGGFIATGNRLQNGTIDSGGAVVWGFSGGGGPTNLNYIT